MIMLMLSKYPRGKKWTDVHRGRHVVEPSVGRLLFMTPGVRGGGGVIDRKIRFTGLDRRTGSPGAGDITPSIWENLSLTLIRRPAKVF